MRVRARSFLSPTVAALLCATFAVALSACGDNSPPRDQIIGGGQTDAGNDAEDATDIDADSDVTVDPACVDVDEGGACDLSNAAGVCVGGECRFLSCETGFADCDDDLSNGCEADITVDERCGACSTECGQTAVCQPSSLGYVCATAPVCLPDRIDLDGDVANGCEFVVSDEGSSLARPSDIDIRAGGLSNDTFWYAGTASTGALVGSTRSDSEPEPLRGASTTGAAVDLGVSGDGARVTAWRRGLSVSSSPQSTGDDVFVQPACEGTHDDHTLTGIEPSGLNFVSSEHGVFQRSSDQSCNEDECLRSVFDRIDYLRAYFPYDDANPPSVAADSTYALASAAVASCETCFLDTTTGQLTADRACLGSTVCAQQPSADCSGCQPDLGQCPDFEPIALGAADNGSRLVVATRTGVVVLTKSSQQWRGAARAEGFMADARAVEATVAAEAGGATVFFLADDKRIYVARVDLAGDAGVRVERPSFEAAIPVDLDSARLHAANANEVMLASRRGAVLVRSTAVGTIQEPITAPETAVDTPTLAASGYDRAERRYGLLYSSLGQLTLQTVAFAPRGEGAAD